MENAFLRKKSAAENPHVRFDEGEVASAKPRRRYLLCKKPGLGLALAGSLSLAFTASAKTFATGLIASVLAGPWTASTNGTDFVSARVPGYHGDTFPGLLTGEVVYRTAFDVEPDADSDYFLEVGLVEYLSEWKVNGRVVGTLRGHGMYADFDCTSALKTGRNELEVRVSSPVASEKYGFLRKDMAYQFAVGDAPGGILRPVRFVARSKVRSESPVVRGDWKSGRTDFSCDLVNTRREPVRAVLTVTVSGPGGEVVAQRVERREIPCGRTKASFAFDVPSPALWEPKTPNLYSLSAVLVPEIGPADRRDVTYGYRDFRVRDGWFELNGKRIYAKGAYLFGASVPLGAAQDPETARRIVWNLRAAGFNLFRLHNVATQPEMLELCDRLGLLVVASHGASYLNNRKPSPELEEEFRRHLKESVRRDVNHASVVAWELQNESRCPAVLKCQRDAIGYLREIDPTRLVFFGSGRWDELIDVGSVANPGSSEWKPTWGAEGLLSGNLDPSVRDASGKLTSQACSGYVKTFWRDSPFGAPPFGKQEFYGDDFTVWYPHRGDLHIYLRTPLSEWSRYILRNTGKDFSRPVYISEIGVNAVSRGGAVADRLDQRGCSDFGNMYVDSLREMRDSLEAAWTRHGLDELYPAISDLTDAAFAESAKCRGQMVDCMRANPKVCGFMLSDAGTVTSALGIFDAEGRIEPHEYPMLVEKNAPLHWCLFPSPRHGFAGKPVTVEAVLANEDALGPGTYPVRGCIYKNRHLVWSVETNLVVVVGADGRTPLAQMAFSEKVVLDEPGEYLVAVTLLRGGEATGGRETITVSEPARAPKGLSVEAIGLNEGEMAGIGKFGISFVPSCDRILVGRKRLSDAEWGKLVRRIEDGAAACFLDPEMLGRDVGEKGRFQFGFYPVKRFPLLPDLSFNYVQHWAYRSYAFVKRDSLTEGLEPGLASDDYFGDTYPFCAFRGPKPLREAVVNLAVPYSDACGRNEGDELHGSFDGVSLGVWPCGKGRIVLSGFRLLADRPERCPAAGKLLVNLVRELSAQESNIMTACERRRN